MKGFCLRRRQYFDYMPSLTKGLMLCAGVDFVAVSSNNAPVEPSHRELLNRKIEQEDFYSDQVAI